MQALAFTFAFVALAGPSFVRAVPTGNTTVVCKPDYSWAENSKGQNPCRVVAELVAAVTCFNQDYTIVPLSSSGWYGNSPAPPECMCNDQAYALFSACSDCQGNGNYLSWGSWTTNCTKTFDNYRGNIPSDTEIPGWANLDVSSKGTYDPVAAKSFALAAASSSSAAASSSSAAAASDSAAAAAASASAASASSASAASASAANASAAATATGAKTAAPPSTGTNGSGPTNLADHAGDDDNGGSKKSNTGAIAGGVVGGVAALAALGALLFFLHRKRSHQYSAPPAAAPYSPDANTTGFPHHTASPGPAMSEYTGAASSLHANHGPNSSISGPSGAPRLYNPDDPSTFPTAGTQGFDPFSTPTRPGGNESVYSGRLEPNRAPSTAPGGYRGYAEV
jgi:hypothetical protein